MGLKLITREQLLLRAMERPEGYIHAVETAADKVDEAGYWFKEAILTELQATWRKYDPSIPQLIANYGQAVAAWVKAGCPIVTEDEFKRRLAACQGCEAWVNNNCRVCGCGRKKLEWETSKCPHPAGSKWEVAPLPL